MKFNFEIVKLPSLSGHRTTFYTAYLPDEDTTLFDRFWLENAATHHEELKKIQSEMKVIAHKTGAPEHIFQKYEGKGIGEGVFALYDKKLRLYFFRVDSCIIILGGGGWKEVRTWEEDDKLDEEANSIRFIAQQIDARIRGRDIWRSRNSMELIGDLIFEFEDDID
jgi:putative component of toxin-antitoxin plasmid stabilization module